MKPCMLALLVPISLLAAPSSKFPWNVRLDYGLLVDGRDGRHYKTIEIDSLEWLAENVKFVTDSSWCYDRDSLNCEIYGRLYRGAEAALACPKGWHLPSAAEWNSLFKAAGDGHVMTRLTATSGWVTTPLDETVIKLSKWIKPIKARQSKSMAARMAKAKALAEAAAATNPPVVPDSTTDDRFGFRIVPAGLRVVPRPQHPQAKQPFGEGLAVESSYSKSNPIFGLEFGQRGTYSYFWSATDIDTSFVTGLDNEVGISIMSSLGTMDPFGFSVRCVQKIGR